MVTTRKFVLKNISNKAVNALGMRIKPGRTSDLFKAIVGLEEYRIYDAMSKPDGELYKKIYVWHELQLIESTLYAIESTIDNYDLRDVRGDLDDNIEDTDRVEALSALNLSEQDESESEIASLFSKITENEQDVSVLKATTSSLESEDDAINARVAYSSRKIAEIGSAMSGKIYLYADGYEKDVLADDLNDAYEGEYTEELVVTLTDADGSLGKVHTWANFTPVVSASESVTDGYVSAPTAEDTDFVSGVMRATIVFDTDGDVTKTYQAGDSVDVTVKVASDDKMLGYTVASFTMTYNVV